MVVGSTSFFLLGTMIVLFCAIGDDTLPTSGRLVFFLVVGLVFGVSYAVKRMLVELNGVVESSIYIWAGMGKRFTWSVLCAIVLAIWTGQSDRGLAEEGAAMWNVFVPTSSTLGNSSRIGDPKV